MTDVSDEIRAAYGRLRALPPAERWHAARELTMRLRRDAGAEADRIREEIIKEMRAEGRSVREIASVLGIGKSRVQQIIEPDQGHAAG